MMTIDDNPRDPHGKELQQDDLVFAMVRAANRDPRRVCDAERFDPIWYGYPFLYRYAAGPA